MRLKWLSILAVMLAWVTGPAFALTGTLDEVKDFGDNPGNLRMFTYVPAGVQPNQSVPVVVALHGCLQTAEDFYKPTGWADLADEQKFILLLPQQPVTGNPMSCFGWYEPGNQAPGKGQPASIVNMLENLKTRYMVAQDKVFVTGLSAGAAMTGVMLATYPQLFAGGAILAGPPYRCAENSLEAAICMGPGHPDQTGAEWGKLVTSATTYAGPRAKVSIWIGSVDSVVNPGNLPEDMQQWTYVLGLSEQPVTTETVPSKVTDIKTKQPYSAEHKTFAAPGKPTVETWLVHGMNHAVPIDTANKCGYNRYDVVSIDQNPTLNNYMADTGICAIRHIAKFWGLSK